MKHTNNKTSDITMTKAAIRRSGTWALGGVSALAALALANHACAQTTDPLLDTLIKKGILTEDEAKSIKTEAIASQSNNLPALPSKWKISNGIKDIELFGDARFRYEYRAAASGGVGQVALERYRYALRLGLRGNLTDNFYYGLRMETAANPRSPWVTFGTSSSGTPYQGPSGKSTAGINLGQLYLGWHPADWVDLTIGKMPNQLYTTPMTWDTDLNPEGLMERFKYTVGSVDFFANFGQFVYEDTNPNHAGSGLVTSFPGGHDANPPFLLAWQAGLTERLTTNVSFKIAGTLYNYTSTGADNSTATGFPSGTPGFSDTFVGEGQNGANQNVNNFDGFVFDQTGINDLLILDIPAQIDFKVQHLRARIFGDFAENLNGAARANAAVRAGATVGPSFIAIPLHKNQNKAYQIGLALGNGEQLGIVYGSTVKKGMWEVRSYWQHVEQYALDPNLLDSDFFEGRGNLEGVYAAAAFGLSDNVIASIRGGYASRIDKSLGTGGNNQDIPQVNPIDRYQILQLDLTYRF